MCISRNFWQASLLLVYGLFLNQNQRWLRPGGVWILDIKSNEEDVNQKSNFHSGVCSQTWSLLLLLSFSHISPMHLQCGAVQLCGERFFFCLCPTYFPLWFRTVEQGGISRTHCLLCSLTCVPFSWVSFSIWHCCRPSGILDGALLVSRLQLSRQMAF